MKVTIDEIVNMAKFAGFGPVTASTYADKLEKFANLIAEKEREAIRQSVDAVHATVSQFASYKESAAYNDALQFVLNLINARGQK